MRSVATVGRWSIRHPWLATIDAVWQPHVDEATATLMIALVRGLLLDRFATGDRARTDAALARFAELAV